MGKLKRAFERFECYLPAEVEELEGKYNLVETVAARDISQEGLKLVINSNINSNIFSGSSIKLKLHCPEKGLSATLSGEIVWIKCVDNELKLGLKIKQMDNKLKKMFVDWAFIKALEKKRG